MDHSNAPIPLLLPELSIALSRLRSISLNFNSNSSDFLLRSLAVHRASAVTIITNNVNNIMDLFFMLADQDW
jgi:hypothetical protein